SNERIHDMAGVLPGEAHMTKRLQALSYVSARVAFDTVLSPAGMSLRGHEFHYSNVNGIPRDARFAYELSRGRGIRDNQDGWVEHNCLASYTHLHFASNRKLPERFIQAASAYHRR
ncbi:MAG: cobyrinic acid a,c-diamide synthase, partial [Candidatus Bathyarchaeia archaeon]